MRIFLAAAVLVATLVASVGPAAPAHAQATPAARIAYQYGGDIWAMNVDGTNKVNLTRGQAMQACCLRVSPDGKRIVFQSGFGPYQVRVINADGSGLTTLTDGNVLGWKYDGSTIYLTRYTGSGWQVYERPADGSGTDVPVARFPLWNAKATAYMWSTSALDWSNVYTTKADGATTLLAQSAIPQDWSPDGSRVLLLRLDERGIPNFWTMDATGANARQITSFTHSGNTPFADWSADGRQILFVTPDLDQVYVMNSDGGGVMPVPNTGQDYNVPRWLAPWTVEDERPSASFTQTLDARDTLSVAFDASASTGEGLTYKWTILNLPPELQSVFTKSDPLFTYRFPATGRYQVALEVRDSKDRTDAAVQPVTVTALRIAFDPTNGHDLVSARVLYPTEPCSAKTELTIVPESEFWTVVTLTVDPSMASPPKAVGPVYIHPTTGRVLLPPKRAGKPIVYRDACFNKVNQQVRVDVDLASSEARLLNLLDVAATAVGTDFTVILVGSQDTAGLLGPLLTSVAAMPHFQAMAQDCYDRLFARDLQGATQCFTTNWDAMLRSPTETRMFFRLLDQIGRAGQQLGMAVPGLSSVQAILALDQQIAAAEKAGDTKLVAKLQKQVAAQVLDFVIGLAKNVGGPLLALRQLYEQVWALSTGGARGWVTFQSLPHV